MDILIDFDIRKAKAGSDPLEYVLAQRLIEAGRKLDAQAVPDPLMLARLHNRLGRTLVALGRPQEAIEFLKAARDRLQTERGFDHPDTLASRNDLALAYQFAGQLDLALPFMEETLTLRKLKLGTDHVDTLVTMHNLANIYSALGRNADALRIHEEAFQLYRATLGPEHSDTLYTMSGLARFLATTVDTKMRDPRRALELATMAAEKSPRNATYRDTLGIARYRAGDWKGAVADLEKANDLRKPDETRNASSAFFLAMAHWQLGEKDKARAWFDKASGLMEKGRREDSELERLRDEAVGLFGGQSN
ncbi:MAG: hypothetical protein KatS3mg110_3228 [Pirellulaceae bacterium]|nr:MAG: hypothetical protein KatS3mg110_3228 [Pirellulaceae bacterium]